MSDPDYGDVDPAVFPTPEGPVITWDHGPYDHEPTTAFVMFPTRSGRLARLRLRGVIGDEAANARGGFALMTYGADGTHLYLRRAMRRRVLVRDVHIPFTEDIGPMQALSDGRVIATQGERIVLYDRNLRRIWSVPLARRSVIFQYVHMTADGRGVALWEHFDTVRFSFFRVGRSHVWTSKVRPDVGLPDVVQSSSGGYLMSYQPPTDKAPNQLSGGYEVRDLVAKSGSWGSAGLIQDLGPSRVEGGFGPPPPSHVAVTSHGVGVVVWQRPTRGGRATASLAAGPLGGRFRKLRLSPHATWGYPDIAAVANPFGPLVAEWSTPHTTAFAPLTSYGVPFPGRQACHFPDLVPIAHRGSTTYVLCGSDHAVTLVTSPAHGRRHTRRLAISRRGNDEVTALAVAPSRRGPYALWSRRQPRVAGTEVAMYLTMPGGRTLPLTRLHTSVGR